MCKLANEKKVLGGGTHNSQFTIHNSQFTMHNAQCTMHNAQCITFLTFLTILTLQPYNKKNFTLLAFILNFFL